MTQQTWSYWASHLSYETNKPIPAVQCPWPQQLWSNAHWGQKKDSLITQWVPNQAQLDSMATEEQDV